MTKRSLSFGQLAAFAAPAAPIAALGLPITVYLPPFYRSLGLEFALVGTIFMIARFWDVITDPVMGVMSDRFSSRWGRRRHWIVISVPILAIAVYFLFMPNSTEISGAYLFFWMFVVYIGYTLISIAHMSWATELTPHYNERSTIHGAREVALIAGMFTVLALPAILETYPDLFSLSEEVNLDHKVASMGWFIIILLPITVFWAMMKVGERPAPEPPKVPYRETLRILSRDRILQRLLAADLAIGLGVGITGSLYLYFYTHFLDVGDNSSTLLLFYFIFGCISVPFWIKMSHKVGKHRTFAIAAIYGGIALPGVFVIPTGSVFGAFIATSTYGIAYGAGPFLLRAIMSDLTDKDNLETGTARTGLYFALLNLTNKVGAALAVGITFIALDIIGFDEKGNNTSEVIYALSFVYVAIPVVCFLLVAWLMWNFPLGLEEQEELQKRIDERDTKKTMA